MTTRSVGCVNRLLLCACIFTVCPAVGLVGQEPPDPNYVRKQIYDSYDEFRAELDRVANIQDATERAQQVGVFWQQLRDAGQVPYAQGNRVAFLYRGAGSVAWPGDANGWNPNSSGWQGTTVGLSDIQILERQLPSDARVDYKVFVNGNWLLDPANPLQMWGGFGPNSELRMPTYSYPHETIHRPNIDHGSLSNNIRITSTNLGYDVNVRVYTPADYDTSSAELPTVYFTDGHEYAAEHLGSAVQVLDNLIADGRLRPAVAVFVDPRDVVSGANRRAEQYITNRNFARFVADELVDYIDNNYSTSDSAGDRTILGTSLGGLNSAYFGIVERDVFQNLAIQSPAFGFDTGIFAAYENGVLADEVRIFMTNGTINDGNGAFGFRDILTAGNYDFTFTTANEGHSWGNWRAQIDDMLIDLVGAPVPEPGGATLSILVLLFVFRRQALVG